MERRSLRLEHSPMEIALYVLREITEEEMVITLKNVYGYAMTSAEQENLALFSCTEIIKDAHGNMYFHKDWQIRPLYETLNMCRERDLARGDRAITKILLPKIDVEQPSSHGTSRSPSIKIIS